MVAKPPRPPPLGGQGGAREFPVAETYERVTKEGTSAGAVPRRAVTSSDGVWELALAGLGILALFLPTYYDLARTVWTDPHEAHGPFIIAIAVAAGVARWRAFLQARGSAPIAGTCALIGGLLIYVLGRSQEFLVLETGSQLPVVVGVILLLKGWQGLRVYWFAVAFLFFSIVWPGWLIDKLTVPLKQAATNITVNSLYALGYPIASTGVEIQIGQYRLLVADACSGLNTMISLLSIGILFLYMIRRTNWLWNAAIILAMPFIAFFANVVRVMALTLITYHFGNRAGQSFLHDFTGVFLFAVALGLVFLLDFAIEKIVELFGRGRANRGAAS